MQKFEIKKGKIINYQGNEKILKIPDSVTHIKQFTLQDNIVEEIMIPASVQRIETRAFVCFENLKYIHVAKDNPYYTSQDGLLLTKDKTHLLFYPPAKPEKEYILPDPVQKIGLPAIRETKYLEKLTLSENIENINTIIFINCKSLVSINVSEKNPYYASIDGVLFDKEITKLITYPYHKQEEKYIIPPTVKTICSYAFVSYFPKEIVFPEGLYKIEKSAFENIQIINLPQQKFRIAKDAFGWSRIQIIKIQENGSSKSNPDFENIRFGLFDNTLKEIQVYENNDLKYRICFYDNFCNQAYEIINLIYTKVTNRYEKLWELLSSREMKFSFLLSRMFYDKNISLEDIQKYQQYISKNGKFILKYVIDQKNIEYLKLCQKYHAVKKSNILWAIDYARTTENYEMQILLMNIQHKKGL